MKITSITKVEEELVTFEGGELTDYYRHGKNNWSVRMGESIETVWLDADLEEAYQNYIKENPIKSTDIWKQRCEWLLGQHYIEPILRFRLDIRANDSDYQGYFNEAIKKIDEQIN